MLMILSKVNIVFNATNIIQKLNFDTLFCKFLLNFCTQPSVRVRYRVTVVTVVTVLQGCNKCNSVTVVTEKGV